MAARRSRSCSEPRETPSPLSPVERGEKEGVPRSSLGRGTSFSVDALTCSVTSDRTRPRESGVSRTGHPVAMPSSIRARSVMRQLLHKVAAIGFLTLLLLWVVGLFVAPPPPAAATAYPSQQALAFNREDVSRLQAANNLRALNMHHVPLPLLLDRQDAEGIRVHEKSA